MNFKFIHNDAGRSQSKRPKQNNDCSVRALSLAVDWEYDYTYDFLANLGRKCSRGFHLQKFLANQSIPGYKFTKLSFPAQKGLPRMNVERFCNTYPAGTFILRMSKHVACIKDGVLLDIWDCRAGKKCVYNAFEIKLVSFQ